MYIQNLFSLIRQPSREAIVPEVVEKENLVKANSKQSKLIFQLKKQTSFLFH